MTFCFCFTFFLSNAQWNWTGTGGCSDWGNICCWFKHISSEVNDLQQCTYEVRVTPGGISTTSGATIPWLIDVYRVVGINILCGYSTPCNENHFYTPLSAEDCTKIWINANFDVCGTLNIAGTGGVVESGPYNYNQEIDIDNQDFAGNDVFCCVAEITKRHN